MKTVEEIKESFQKYKVDLPSFANPEEFALYVEILKTDLEKDMSQVKSEYHHNEKSLKRAKFKAKIIPYSKDDIQYYEEDNQYLERKLSLILEWKNYYEMMQKEVSKSNMELLSHLIDFTREYYQNNSEYIDALRESLKYAFFSGIASFDYRKEDTREVYKQFLEGILEEIRQKKMLQKREEI